tara:strand:+ start:383 stop:790 length:408 start_codon:yes stop_codon:yes gene_type:complete
MRINRSLQKILEILLSIFFVIAAFAAMIFGLVFLINAIWWLIDNVFISPSNFFGFIAILYIIASFALAVKNSLKENKKELTKKNIISEIGLQLLIAGLFILVIYFIISVWSINPYLIIIMPITFLGYKLIYEKNK